MSLQTLPNVYKAYFIVFGVCLFISNLEAADWSSSTDIATGVQYTDNFFFTNIDKVSESFIRFIPAFDFARESESSRVILGAGVSIERYKRIKEANREDPFADFNWQHYWEQNTFRFLTSYQDASTRTSELETTGRVNVFGTRTNIRGELGWNTQLNELNNLDFSVAMLDVTYDLPTFFDFQDYSFLVNWAHQLGPESTFNLNLNSKRYNSEELGVDFDYGMLLAGYSDSSSERFRYALSLGAGYGVREVGDDFTAFLINAQFISELEYDYIEFAIRSDLTPSSQGDLRQVYGLDFNYRHDMTENLNFTFATSYSQSFPADEEVTSRTKTFNLRPGLHYQMTEKWSLETWYRYIKNKTEDSEAVSSNSVYLGVRYLNI